VTETVLIRNLDASIEQITRLREIGVQFAIDDFGTGYSSLNQLRTLPVDVVKIDRSFINEIGPSDGDGVALVRGIISLAHSLELKVVAEGVESEDQYGVLRTLGCDVNQGFLFHRPMTSEAIESLLIAAWAADPAHNSLESIDKPRVEEPVPALA